ncbi:histidine kinase [Hymenobacter sp. ASUV-10]|uniref:Histidine kinase n=1 Tax=Hymenobacter aranciens TaxID=3063996 RepID=A0ABT9B5G7_9BACT|nr:tetratricopeptide repeat-containing sensor histidine kinase [Hymenobacter sp. ASUV-10]MDO7873511.1 histidine kinase [Hymenobacter sp. ASUV-10]
MLFQRTNNRQLLITGAWWLLTWLPLGARAQQPANTMPADTLWARLRQPHLPDTLQVQYRGQLADLLRRTDLAAGRSQAQQALALAQRLHYLRGIALAELLLGKIEVPSGHLLAAYTHYQAALRIYTALHSQQQVARCLEGLGAVASQQAHYAQAVAYYEQAHDLYQQLTPRSLDGELRTLTNTANMYEMLNRFAEAERTNRRLLALTQTPDGRFDRQRIVALSGVSAAQARAGHPDSSLVLTQEALALARRLPDTYLELAMLSTLTQTYSVLGDLPAAERTAQEAVRLGYRSKQTSQLENALGNLAVVMHRLGRAAAFDTLASYNALHEDLRNAGQAQALTDAQTRYDVAGKQARIQELEQSRRLASLQATALRLQAGQREATYRDTLGRRAARQTQERLRQQLAAQQQTAHLAATTQQVQALTQRTQLQTQQARLQAQAAELARLRTRQERAGLGVLVVLLLAGAGVLFARYRRRQATARAAAATALRQRLAADLHDDVGNLLTQISMQSSLLREVPGSPAQLLARLDQLTTTARQATQQMSDVVWGLHQTQQTLPELLERMSDHAHEVLYPLGIEIDFEASPAATAAPLAPEALQSLYLIYKEALHNVVKHARATRVTVRLDHSAAGLRLLVRDNGQGHDGTARLGGNGLRNMQTRAQAVGGIVAYEEAGPGFAVVATLPAAVGA